MQQAKLGGEVESVKNKHLFENRNLTIEQYISKFRAGAIKGKLPSEAAQMTVAEGLRKGRIGGVNVRKLILDTREKFCKKQGGG